jgi:aryl-alcohol dehydrogenase-like predicted oxidoreductase
MASVKNSNLSSDNEMQRKATIGSSGIQVAPLAFGGNVFGWTVDEKTSFRLLDAFVDGGFDLVDTANMYSAWVPGHSGGESESIIGNWIRATGKRDSVVIATKVGMTMGDGSKGLRKEYILKSVEDSLRRLKTDCIDLYQSHADDPEVPIEETLEAYSQLIREGKVRAIGASNFTAERLRESLEKAKAAGVPAYCSLQPEYNLYDREGFESTLAPVCEEYGLGVISYYSLASGFLTGKYRSKEDLGKSVRGGSIGESYLNERGFRILKALDQVCETHRVSPATVSLAWLMQRPGLTAPIASATSETQLGDLMRAARIELSSEEVALLDQASEWK